MYITIAQSNVTNNASGLCIVDLIICGLLFQWCKGCVLQHTNHHARSLNLVVVVAVGLEPKHADVDVAVKIDVLTISVPPAGSMPA